MVTPSGTTAESARDTLLQLVLGTPTVEAYLDALVLMAAGMSPTLAGCGVTLRRDGNVLSVATSNPRAASVDEVQYGMATGPCLESLRTGAVISVPDLVEEDRWGAYPQHAVSSGIRSSLSVRSTWTGRPSAR